jgi:DNA-binding transcriptional LysR family regulator
VSPILVRYPQRYPEVDAQCLFLDRAVNLVEKGIDVAVFIGELPDSSLLAARAGRVRRVLVAAPAYLQTKGIPAHPRASDCLSCSALRTVEENWLCLTEHRTRFDHWSAAGLASVNPGPIAMPGAPGQVRLRGRERRTAGGANWATGANASWRTSRTHESNSSSYTWPG